MEPSIDVALALAVDKLPTEPGLAYEPKWDGHRATLERTADHVVLRSKTGRVITSAWIDLAKAGMQLQSGVILDGEIVIYRGGQLDFGAVQQRAASGPARGYVLARELPASYAAFDILQHQGVDVRRLPYSERRALLLEVLAPLGPPLQPTSMTTDPEQARIWFEVLREQGIEGLVIKRLTSKYPSGRREWRKLRHADTVDAAVVGYMGVPARPTHVVVRLPDGRIMRSRALTVPLRTHLGRLLPDLGPGRRARTADGEAYTTCMAGVTVEVLAGTTRHVTVTVTRVRA
ncbi:ATP-dependent DNA ligase [Streptomyces sp. NPDC051320]|uniref:ATP-dependent DNA ligase n=1 Tax=Streptomyces sp. NPDC051320 TaxID=3154644 RepID=UPI00341ACB60